MAPRKAARNSLTRVLVLAVIGTGVLAGVLGYALGTSQNVGRFTPDQSQFLVGLVQGTRFRIDFEAWRDDPKRDPQDIAGEPEARCAGDYYPEDPFAMSGCVQALNDPPPEGYRIPADRR